MNRSRFTEQQLAFACSRLSSRPCSARRYRRLPQADIRINNEHLGYVLVVEMCTVASPRVAGGTVIHCCVSLPAFSPTFSVTS